MNANIEMPVFRGPASSVPRVGPACPLPATPGLPVRSVNGRLPDRTGAVALVLGDLVDPGSAGATRTLADYNISDAKIENGVITLGPSSVMLSDFAPASRLSDHLADLLNPHQVTKSQVGLGNVDNTPDADKPVSGPQRAALDLKADKSDVYTKTETGEQIAEKIAEIVAEAPARFDTLKEIADWIQSDTTGAAKMSSDIETLKSGKQAKITASGLLKGDGAGGVSAATKSDVTALGIPGQDTTYAPATRSTQGVGGTDGLMSAVDKEKLDGVAPGATAVIVDPTLSVEGKAADAKATGDALDARPTKAQLDAGWWSEWTVTFSGANAETCSVTSIEYASGVWRVTVAGDGFTGEISVQGQEDAVILQSEFDLGAASFTATRHRVAAPMPTKTSDLTNDSGFLTQHQQLTPVYGGNGERFGEWGNFVISDDVPPSDFYVQWTDEYNPACWGLFIDQGGEERLVAGGSTNVNSTNEVFDVILGTVTATRTENPIVGYKLGSQADKPLQPQGDYAPATNIPKAALASGVQTSLGKADTAVQPSALADKLDSTSAAEAFSTLPGRQYTVGDYCTYNGKLYICRIPTTGGTWDSNHWNEAKLPKMPLIVTPGHLASFGPDAALTDSGIAEEDVALKGAIPYTLGASIVIDTASSEVVEGETVTYGAATLADRTANRIEVTAAIAELRLTFPAAVSGKVRDFGLRVEVGTGSAALAAPALAPVAPTGETVTLENADGEIPALADGAADAKGVTLLYFSETAPGKFLVKGEEVKEA